MGTGWEGSGKGKGKERKNEGQNNIFCAKTCKCQIFFVTLQAGRNWGNNRRNTAENRTPLRLRENTEGNVTQKGKSKYAAEWEKWAETNGLMEIARTGH